MDTQTFRKFCPVCKLVNDANATVCQHCQAPLTGNLMGPPTTRRVDKSFELSEELRDQITKTHLPPPVGMSLFVLNSGEAVAVCPESEFILGRGEDPTLPPVVDLTEFEAFEKGVSRRHALIKAAGDKYILLDNKSSNGTWLNGDRLLPNNPHVLSSGSVIQLGRLKLVVVYAHPPG